MLKCMVMVKSKDEIQPLLVTLNKLNVEVILSKPDYSDYKVTVSAKPDLILIEMPVKRQKQLHYIQMVKQHNELKHTPIICFGNALEDRLLQGMKSIGVDHYFAKPINTNEFRALIVDYIRETTGHDHDTDSEYSPVASITDTTSQSFLNELSMAGKVMQKRRMIKNLEYYISSAIDRLEEVKHKAHISDEDLENVDLDFSLSALQNIGMEFLSFSSEFKRKNELETVECSF